MLLLSGPDIEWLADSMECQCSVRNVQDLVSDGKTLQERRFGIPVNGPVIPLGAMVEHHRVSAKDTSRLHQFGPKVLPGIPLLCIVCGRESGEETFLEQTLKSWSRWTHLESTPEGSMLKKW